MSSLKGACTRTEALCPSEHQEQVALMQWWRIWPGKREALLFAVPNGGLRRIKTAAELRSEGVLAGVPDLFLAALRDGQPGLWIEMKRRHGGRVSEAQRAVHTQLNAAGYPVAVCRGWEEARDAIVTYPSGDASTSAAL